MTIPGLWRAGGAALVVLLAIAAAPASRQGGRVSTETGEGLHTVRLETPQGSISVLLPDDAAATDTITGTVSHTPSGDTDAEREKNLGELRGYVVDVAGQPVAEGPTWTRSLPRLPGPIVIRFHSPRGTPVAEAPVPARAPVPPVREGSAPGMPGLEVPAFGQAGRPVEIYGRFPGDPGATQVTIGGHEAPFLARSPRKTVVRVPSEPIGPGSIRIENEDTAAEAPFRVLAVALSAGKLDLKRGERTTMRCEVSGLVGLDETVPLTLTNRSPQVIHLGNREVERITIQPGEVTPQGTFVFERPIQSLQTGSFAVNVAVDPARRTSPPELVQQGKCDCREVKVRSDRSRSTVSRGTAKESNKVTLKVPVTADIWCRGNRAAKRCEGESSFKSATPADWNVTYRDLGERPPADVEKTGVTVGVKSVELEMKLKSACNDSPGSSSAVAEVTLELPDRPDDPKYKGRTIEIRSFSGSVSLNFETECGSTTSTETFTVDLLQAAPAVENGKEKTSPPAIDFADSDFDGNETPDFDDKPEAPCSCQHILGSLKPAPAQKKAGPPVNGQTALELELEYEIVATCEPPGGTTPTDCKGAMLARLDSRWRDDDANRPARVTAQDIDVARIECSSPCQKGEAVRTGKLLYKVKLTNKANAKGSIGISLQSDGCVTPATDRFTVEIDATQDPPKVEVRTAAEPE